MNPKNIEAAARAAYEANRAYCVALKHPTQPPWEQASEEDQASYAKRIRGVLAGNGPQQSHESWLVEKAAAGWKFGPVKDVEKKEHPCFRPYAELPPEQQYKDFLFIAVARAMLTALGALET